MDQHNAFFKLLEWVWIPVVASIVHLYAKLFGLDSDMSKALGIVQTTVRHHDIQRVEDNDRTQREVAEIKDKIDRHHETVMNEIRSLRDDLKQK